MDHRQYTGRRVRRRRQRRRLKAVMLAGVVAGLVMVGTWTTWTPPEPPQELCEQELAVARTLYELSGDRGFAHEYLVKCSPEQEAYIRAGK